MLKPSPRTINIHISVLPYNRGADPNFWSWFDNTPKGVTIHQIDEGMDTGAIYAQSIICLEGHTLRTSYEALMQEATQLFAMSWPAIRAGQIPVPQTHEGTYHRAADKERWMQQLDGWDTPCEKVEALGLAFRKNLS